MADPTTTHAETVSEALEHMLEALANVSTGGTR